MLFNLLEEKLLFFFISFSHGFYFSPFSKNFVYSVLYKNLHVFLLSFKSYSPFLVEFLDDFLSFIFFSSFMLSILIPSSLVSFKHFSDLLSLLFRLFYTLHFSLNIFEISFELGKKLFFNSQKQFFLIKLIFLLFNFMLFKVVLKI